MEAETSVRRPFFWAARRHANRFDRSKNATPFPTKRLTNYVRLSRLRENSAGVMPPHRRNSRKRFRATQHGAFAEV